MRKPLPPVGCWRAGCAICNGCATPAGARSTPQKQGEKRNGPTRMEVRRGDESTSVSRGRFLTGKISAGRQTGPPERSEPDPDIVDPGIDSLLPPSAKLGASAGRARRRCGA